MSVRAISFCACVPSSSFVVRFLALADEEVFLPSLASLTRQALIILSTPSRITTLSVHRILCSSIHYCVHPFCWPQPRRKLPFFSHLETDASTLITISIINNTVDCVKKIRSSVRLFIAVNLYQYYCVATTATTLSSTTSNKPANIVRQRLPRMNIGLKNSFRIDR